MKFFWVRYKGGRVRSVAVPVDPLALALIFGETFVHLKSRNPQFTDEQLETITVQLLPEVCYRLYRDKIKHKRWRGLPYSRRVHPRDEYGNLVPVEQAKPADVWRGIVYNWTVKDHIEAFKVIGETVLGKREVERLFVKKGLHSHRKNEKPLMAGKEILRKFQKFCLELCKYKGKLRSDVCQLPTRRCPLVSFLMYLGYENYELWE